MHQDYEQSLIAARSHLAIPSQSDFCADLGGDAGYAWRNFGGLDLHEAYQRFLEGPAMYQEDFMWMFPRAFEYYYPVVDRYLKSVSVHDGGDAFYGNCQAWILGCAIESQFHWTNGSRPPDYVISEISQLLNFVRGHLHHYSLDADEQIRIDKCWEKLGVTLSQ